MMTIQIKKAVTAKDFEQGGLLLEAYAGSLGFDLEYQDFKKELETLAQQYKEPDGALLLCFTDKAQAIGCVGLRRFSEGIAELKRLYVQPGYRGLKIGKQLLEAAIETARQLQYRLLRLDTVPGQEQAQELYRCLGFYTIAPYRYSPIAGTLYLEKDLTGDR